MGIKEPIPAIEHKERRPQTLTLRHLITYEARFWTPEKKRKKPTHAQRERANSIQKDSHGIQTRTSLLWCNNANHYTSVPFGVPILVDHNYKIIFTEVSLVCFLAFTKGNWFAWELWENCFCKWTLVWFSDSVNANVLSIKQGRGGDVQRQKGCTFVFVVKWMKWEEKVLINKWSGEDDRIGSSLSTLPWQVSSCFGEFGLFKLESKQHIFLSWQFPSIWNE